MEDITQFGRHRGDGKRFHSRMRHGKHQVYGVDLQHICDCDDDEDAERVMSLLENAADEIERLRQDIEDYEAIFARKGEEIRQLQAEVERLSHECGRREPTRAEVRSACMSYDHSFGLKSAEEQSRMETEAREWLHAWINEGARFEGDRANS